MFLHWHHSTTNLFFLNLLLSYWKYIAANACAYIYMFQSCKHVWFAWHSWCTIHCHDTLRTSNAHMHVHVPACAHDCMYKSHTYIQFAWHTWCNTLWLLHWMWFNVVATRIGAATMWAAINCSSGCNFPACRRQANVTPIPKCPAPSSSVANYRPISITSISTYCLRC